MFPVEHRTVQVSFDNFSEHLTRNHLSGMCTLQTLRISMFPHCTTLTLTLDGSFGLTPTWMPCNTLQRLHSRPRLLCFFVLPDPLILVHHIIRKSPDQK